jgi:alpha-N-arabinofuranosidase
MTSWPILILIVLLIPSYGQQSQAKVDISYEVKGPVINKNIYGHFAEHLGRCIYDGFYVGDSSSIPNDEGVRKDIIDALKKMKIPLLRWPGGCFADTYHWKDGIGPKSKRPSMVNTWWGGVTEDNSFGVHEFLGMCEKLETQPYLAGNIGSGTVQELSDWVQYVNSDSKNLSDLRKQNGRSQPWNVKYWGVGNEAWGCGGNMTPGYYANEYRKYATFMSDWSNTGAVHISLVNIDVNNTRTVNINIPGEKKITVKGRILHSQKIQDHNTFEEPEKIKPSTFTDFSNNNNKLSLSLPPASVIVLYMK